VVATGFHRLTTQQELIAKFGKELCQQEDIAVHDSRNRDHLVYKGKLPSGGHLWLNDLVDWADMVVAEVLSSLIFRRFFPGDVKVSCPVCRS